MRSAFLFASLSVLLLVCSAIACVSREHRELREAQDAYGSCVDEKGAHHDECAELKAHLVTVQERYERRARKAWNCETSPEECPRQR